MPGNLPGMGKAVEQSPARELRPAARQDFAELSSMHPALRWIAGDEDGRAHRRRADGHTACGRLGPLVLASRDAAFCAVCYPYWSSVRS